MRELLAVATERLYVEQGPSVSLRDIALAADQRNNSAVNYYFGSRDGLISYVVRLRTQAMERLRLDLLASLPENAALHDLVRVIVEPTLTTPYEQGATHYARFVELVRTHHSVREGLDDLPATRIVLARVRDRVGHLDDGRRERRILAMSTTLFALAADREARYPSAGTAAAVEELTGMLVGLLDAP